MALLSACATEQGNRLAIVDVNVLPMNREVVLERQTVVVADGRITSVGPAETTAIPQGARRIDGRGLYLMPGLADMHVHFARAPSSEPSALGFEDHALLNVRLGALHVTHGVTMVREMFGNAATDAFAARIAREEVLGPTIASTGPLTDGVPAVHPSSRVLHGPDDVAAAVREDASKERVGVKVYNRLDLDTYRSLAAAARTDGLVLTGHVPLAVGLGNVISERQATIEHIDSFLRDLQQIAPTGTPNLAELYRNADASRLDAFLAEMVAAGTFVTPTLVVSQMDWPPERVAPGMAAIPPEFVERYSEYFSGLGFGELNAADELALGLAVVRKLHAAGVPLLAGTDAVKPNVAPGFALIEELEYFSQAGLTPYEALRTATVNPAKLLRQEHAFGTVAEGRRADLLLLSANPLEDVGALRRLTAVILRGRFYTVEALSRRTEADLRALQRH